MRWITFTLNAQLDVAATLTSADALGALTVAEKNEIGKVLRIHGMFEYSAEVGGSHVFGRFGLIVVTDDAMATGGGALPDAGIDTGSPWMMTHPFSTEADNLAIPREIPLDVKVKRRIPQQYTLAFSHKVDPAATTALHWSVSMRLLLEHR